MAKKNIILCGFMGCGKTTVGKELAWRIFYNLVDTDERIEAAAGKAISDIFAQDGEGAFRGLESKVLREVLQDSGQVIALGGGALMRQSNVEAAKSAGRIIFLNTEFDTCYSRIESGNSRPLVTRSTREEMQELYNERLPVYRAAADFEIFNQHTPKDAAKAILTSLFSFL